MLAAKGCSRIIVVIVAVAVVGLVWSIRASPHGFGGILATFVGAICGFVVVLAAIVVALNAPQILDWILVRTPPVVRDPVLGELHYEDGMWSAEFDTMRYSFPGRRRGPAPEYVSAGAHVVSQLDEFERRAREYALADRPDLGSIGELEALGACDGGKGVGPVVELWFALSPDPEDYLRVGFVGDTPSAVEAPLHPPPEGAA
jgi:hypothetical protein